VQGNNFHKSKNFKGDYMQIGVVFPQTEFGHQPQAILDYAQTAEGLGYSHILAYDHVLGANPNRPGGWKGPYTHLSPFLEPFVLFSFIAAVTHTIGLTTGILILPQRQTVLVAKQSATLDVLSGGRLRLGIGLGWNEVEYRALNQDFHNRGQRIDEQIIVLNLLWSNPLVQYEGIWHTIPDAGLKPLPVQRPIPIWLGGHAHRVLQRVAKYGQGWMPNYRQPAEALPSIQEIYRLLNDEKRDPNKFGIEARLPYGVGNADEWERIRNEWEAVGATHLTLNTMGSGFIAPEAHIEAIQRFATEMGITPL
jgi:probable F420-dependent oxidoreductase